MKILMIALLGLCLLTGCVETETKHDAQIRILVDDVSRLTNAVESLGDFINGSTEMKEECEKIANSYLTGVTLIKVDLNTNTNKRFDEYRFGFSYHCHIVYKDLREIEVGDMMFVASGHIYDFIKTSPIKEILDVTEGRIDFVTDTSTYAFEVEHEDGSDIKEVA